MSSYDFEIGETEIKYKRRIEGLENFYINQSSQKITEEDVKGGSGNREDLLGRNFLDRLDVAAKELKVEKYVSSDLERMRKIPEIPNHEEYRIVFMAEAADMMEVMESSVQSQELHVAALREELEERNIIVQSFMDEEERIMSANIEGEGKEESEKERNEKIEKLDVKRKDEKKRIRGLIGVMAEKEQGLSREKLGQRKLKLEAENDAAKQHGLDSDARRRLDQALLVLRDYMVRSLKKMPSVSHTARKVDDEGRDPLDTMNLQLVMRNLVDKYRNKGDSIQILTLILEGMKDECGDRSMDSWVRGLEEKYRQLLRMGVTEISLSDLIAMMGISGLSQKDKEAYIEFQQHQELLMEREMSTIMGDSQSVKEGRELFSFLKKFVLLKAQSATALGRIDGKGGKKKEEKKKDERGDKKNPNVNVFAMKDVKNCPFFEKNGYCSIPNCKGTHKSIPPRRGQPGECAEFKDKGYCMRGTNCPLTHVKSGLRGVEKQVEPKPHSVFGAVDSAVDYSSDEAGDTDQARVVVERDKVFSVTEREKKIKLGWDSMAGINVLADECLISQSIPLKANRMVQGVGGVVGVKKRGRVGVLGNDIFSVLEPTEGSVDTNLLSVARSVRPNADGESGLVMMLPKGAVRIRCNTKIYKMAIDLVNEATRVDRVEAEATVENNVYVQTVSGERGDDIMKRDCDVVCNVKHIYSNRVPLSSAEEVVGLLSAGGISKGALLNGIKEEAILGIPKTCYEQDVQAYFDNVGPDEEILKADATNLPLRRPIDYGVGEETVKPGQIVVIDNVDPSFSRTVAKKDKKAKVVKSLQGYNDAILAVDESSGYLFLMGRQRKKNPHLVLERVKDVWGSKFDDPLRKFKVDDEFVTVDSMRMSEATGIEIVQAVPAQHSRVIGQGEGNIRRVQDSAQANMNRVKQLVERKKIKPHMASQLWFHALRLGVIVGNLKESRRKNGKTRFEEGMKSKPNLSKMVILPFAMEVVVRRPTANAEGRGYTAIYLGPSETVPGGILTLNVKTGRVAVRYAFVPRDKMPILEDLNLGQSINYIYGDLMSVGPKAMVELEKEGVVEETGGVEEQDIQKEGNNSNVYGEEENIDEVIEAPVVIDPGGDKLVEECCANEDGTSHERGKRVRKKAANRLEGVLPGQTSGVAEAEVALKKVEDYGMCLMVASVLDLDAMRPPQPPLPSRSEARNSHRWKLALKREVDKILEECVLGQLAVDNRGRTVRPNDAIVLRMLRVNEWKWKENKEDGFFEWLECVRLVLDGSKDKRDKKMFYAITPDRTLVFMMLAVGASKGAEMLKADAVRAYLNAPSIDKNIVVQADDIDGIRDESILLKGLYGSKGGALSWEIWCDDILVGKLEFEKCKVARGVYKKDVDGVNVNILRHSDDFLFSSEMAERLETAYSDLKEEMRLTKEDNMDRFLGCEIKRVDNVVLLRQLEKINELEASFGYLRETYNRKGRRRITSAPENNIRLDEDLDPERRALLDAELSKVFQQVTGAVNWIVKSTRPDGMFAYWVCSKRLAAPRQYDMYLLVWNVEYLIETKYMPLVLGGEGVQLQVVTDASFATLKGRKSVCGHLMRCHELGGAVYAEISATTSVVNSIFEAELISINKGVNSLSYGGNVFDELEYAYDKDEENVLTDSQTCIDWIRGSSPTKNSRHLEVALYRLRDMKDQGKIKVKHVVSKENEADILTKSLNVTQVKYLAPRILGHRLCEGMDMSLFSGYQIGME